MSQRTAQSQAETPTSNTTTAEANGSTVTPELVREIADRVYSLLKQDLKIQGERRRVTRYTRGT